MKHLNRTPLNGLRAIEVVGRLGGLQPAADALGVTVGAVSQQIQKTERQLGRPLFERHPKGLKPTSLGEEVLHRLTTGFAELEGAVALASGAESDVLTISAAPVFAGKFLVWRLNQFHELHPEIKIRLDAEVTLIDPTFSDVDACIRVGPGGWPGVKAEKLHDHIVFPVCHPDMAKTLSTPADLSKIPIIRDPRAMFDWSVWLGPHGLTPDILGEGPIFSDASLCLDAAIAGQGAFLAWDTLANDAMERGCLVAPFPGRYPTGDAYWLVTGREGSANPHVRAFKVWLKAELSSLAVQAQTAKM
ncbi:MAG: LysR substrate-binding domain-containing protein [Pseudomonadota bacterium]